MKKRIICLLLAALMLFSIVGCKGSGDTTSDVVSYITEYEDVYEEVELDEEADGEESGKSGTTKKTSTVKKGNGNKGDGNVNDTAGKGDLTGDSVKGLNFGGKTFRKTIIGAIPAVTVRRKAAFEKKYNCKLELVSLQWEQFNSQCATAVAAGTPYDICGAQTFFWPEAGVKNLYEPLNDYISTDDLYNAKTGVGIDLEKSNYFALNGKIYAVCNHHGNCADMLNVMYYNRVKFDEAYGDPDYPLTLYKAGKWTWDEFIKLAKEVKDEASGTYLVGQDLTVSHFTSMNGWSGVKTVDGKVVENTSDPKYLEALKYWQDNIIKSELRGPGGNPSDNYNAILAGTQWMHVQGYNSGTYYMYDGVCGSTSFEKDFKNLGIVPLPMGPSNTEGLYNSGGPQGKAAGMGTAKKGDPRIVIAWTKFDLEFNDPTAKDDPTLYSDATYDMIWKLFDKLVYATPNFKTSAQSAGSLYNNIANAANKADGDIVKEITANSKNIQSIIDEALGQ